MKTLLNMAITVLIVAGLIVYNQNPSDWKGGLEQQWSVGIFCGVLAVGYLLPTFIAFGRGHSNAVGLMIFNIFLGWTFVSWIVCLILSFANAAPVVVEHRHYVSGEVEHYPNAKGGPWGGRPHARLD